MCDSLCSAEYRAAVIGIGSPIRGEDSVGILAVQQVDLSPSWASDPVDLLHQFGDLDAVVIVDAAIGPSLGQVDVWTLPQAKEAILPEKGVSHILGLRDALLLAEAMDLLPPYLRLVTVGIGDTGLGTEVDARIFKAAGEAARTAERLLQEAAAKDFSLD